MAFTTSLESTNVFSSLAATGGTGTAAAPGVVREEAAPPLDEGAWTAAAPGEVEAGAAAEEETVPGIGFGAVFETLLLARQRLRIGLGLADLLGDGVGIVGEIDARVVRRIGLRHLLGAVAQRHHPRRRPLDQRLRQREEGVAQSASRDRLWVTETATDRIAEYSLRGKLPRQVASYPTLRQPNSAAVDPRTGAVFVAGRDAGRIERIAPRGAGR